MLSLKGRFSVFMYPSLALSNINMQYNLATRVQTEWYINNDGTINMVKLLSAFQQFFRENSESWIQRFDYQEAGPQLLLQAFLQRVINGGGRIEREYGLGRGRTDLLLQWPLNPQLGFLGPVQKIVVELKILHRSLENTIADGLMQVYEYCQRCGGQQAHLMIFHRDPNLAWDDRCFLLQKRYRNLNVQLWGC